MIIANQLKINDYRLLKLVTRSAHAARAVGDVRPGEWSDDRQISVSLNLSVITVTVRDKLQAKTFDKLVRMSEALAGM